MPLHRSYFSKNNTLMSHTYTNTAMSPYVELFFGNVENVIMPNGFTRFIFDLDLEPLLDKIENKEITYSCVEDLKHILRMKNTSFFDKELLNETWSNGRRRATSFDLFIYRIPLTEGNEGEIQSWDEGVGYDYYLGKSYNSSGGSAVKNKIESDKSFSDRPSNWFQRQTVNNWSLNGIYDNTNSHEIEGLNYSGLTIIDTQHFEMGNEDIEFDMTEEINLILKGEVDRPSGWGISFVPKVENISGMTENYSVGFFSRYTQTFYEPYLETEYFNLVDDDRFTFFEKKNNKLYLYSNVFGDSKSLDNPPTVDIYDMNGDVVEGFTDLESCEISRGVYEINISGLTSDNLPCMMYDVWKGISIDGIEVDDIENDFVLNPFKDYLKINTKSESYDASFSISGIKNDEKIINTDVKKVEVFIKKAFSSKEILHKIDVQYRIYVKEGMTEVEVEKWTNLNRNQDGYYFFLDTKDKIPNEYFIDFKLNTDISVNTYKKQLKFQIVNKK